MLTATLTVTYDGSSQYQSSDESIVSVTGSGAGTRLRLWPTNDDTLFTLTFAASTGISSLNSLTTPATAFGGGLVTPDGAGNLVLNCDVAPPYHGWAFTTLLDFTPQGALQSLAEDPTIVFNPPSGTGGAEITNDQTAGAPLLAEAVMA